MKKDFAQFEGDLQKVGFLISTLEPKLWPKADLPELAFLGRSNVGKSSVLNRLVRRRGLALVSKEPGRTRAINFFEVPESWRLVDLPGYGFAKISVQLRDQWDVALNAYIGKRPNLRGLVMIMDMRHAPTDLDHNMLTWLAEFHHPVLGVLNKADKLSPEQQQRRVKEIKDELHGMRQIAGLVPFSATTELGRPELLHALFRLLHR